MSNISKEDLDNLLLAYNEKYHHVQLLIQEHLKLTALITEYADAPVSINDNLVSVLRFRRLEDKMQVPFPLFRGITQQHRDMLLVVHLELKPIHQFSILELISTQLTSSKIGIQLEQHIDQYRILGVQMKDLNKIYRDLFKIINELLPENSIFSVSNFSHIKFLPGSDSYESRISSATYAAGLRIFLSTDTLFDELKGRNNESEKVNHGSSTTGNSV